GVGAAPRQWARVVSLRSTPRAHCSVTFQRTAPKRYRKQIELDSIRRSPHASPSASSPDRPSLHRREQSSPVKNRKREICTSGSARGRGGNIPTYSAQGQGRSSDRRAWHVRYSATKLRMLLPRRDCQVRKSWRGRQNLFSMLESGHPGSTTSSHTLPSTRSSAAGSLRAKDR